MLVKMLKPIRLKSGIKGNCKLRSEILSFVGHVILILYFRVRNKQTFQHSQDITMIGIDIYDLDWKILKTGTHPTTLNMSNAMVNLIINIGKIQFFFFYLSCSMRHS